MNLVDLFRKQNVEQEVRVAYDRQFPETLLNLPGIETKTLDVIMETRGDKFTKKITTITFVNNKALEKKTFIEKRKLGTYNFTIGDFNCKFSVSSETEIPSFSSNSGSILFRAKWRKSINLQDWRLDLTAVMQFINRNDITENIKSLFTGNFQDKFLPDAQNKTEMEFERQTPLPIFETNNECINYLVNELEPHLYINSAILKNPVAKIAKLLGVYGNTIRQIANKPVTIMRKNIAEIKPEEWFITDKADGERVFILADEKSEIIKDAESIPLKIPCPNKIILDCELINGIPYVFDILYFNKSITDLCFQDRNKLCSQAAAELGLKQKQFYALSDLESFKKYEKTLKYKTDGYILTKCGNYYDKNYKIKSAENLTIDFLVIDEYLFVGISQKVFNQNKMTFIPEYDQLIKKVRELPGRNSAHYFPVPFATREFPRAFLLKKSARTADLTGKICEFRIADIDGPIWEFVRVRTDRAVSKKYFGNDYEVAKNTLECFQNPVTLEDLFQKPYFQEHDNILYQQARHYNSYVKSQIMGKYSGQRRHVLDLASGKGQDLPRYKTIAAELTCIDNDPDALEELKRRASKILSITPAIHRLNLLSANEDILGQVGKKFDMVVCNLALNYLISNQESLEKFARLVNDFLQLPKSKNKSVFMYMAFDGKKIKKLGDWDYHENGILKYSIKVSDNKVSAILPFTAGEYYTEYILDTDAIIAEFKKYGFTATRTDFDSFPKFKELDKGDQIFVSLYVAVEFVR